MGRRLFILGCSVLLVSMLAAGAFAYLMHLGRDPWSACDLFGAVILSLCLAAMVSLTPTFVRMQRQFTRRDRIRRGCCPKCGYDLRANWERCSECGEEIGSKT